ncbi:hypothetical protein ElyMa_003927900 [Elysia marginata]|uniref:Serine/arginine repetitive matrix protein C-terminal domain-containing protein n=1 Tax=Elysia marginata TaxID=1093978 RepID=A0AAV4FRL1_9GAST|nr:hypothetical protein ElyMa_003927900 [Elysia marginata]
MTYKQSGNKRGRRSSVTVSGRAASSPRRRRARSWYDDFPRGSPSALLFNQPRNGRKRSKSSLYRRQRSRRASSPRRRRSKASAQRRSSRASVSSGGRKRGRPRGSGKKSRSSASVAELGHLAQGKSFGLLDRVSTLWRSCSFSRSATPAQTPSATSRSSASHTESWVTRILPAARSKHQRRLQRHRDKARKYSRSRKDDRASAKRKTSSHSSGGKKEKQLSRSICAIM